MKRPLLSLTLLITSLVALPTMMSAEDAKPEAPRRGQRSPEERVKEMNETLQLTDEQKEKAKAVFVKNQEKWNALREDTGLSQDDRRAKMREFAQGITEELKLILT